MGKQGNIPFHHKWTKWATHSRKQIDHNWSVCGLNWRYSKAFTPATNQTPATIVAPILELDISCLWFITFTLYHVRYRQIRTTKSLIYLRDSMVITDYICLLFKTHFKVSTFYCCFSTFSHNISQSFFNWIEFSSSVMPIEHLYIARVIDGLILVASMDHASSTGSNQQMEVYKSQV